MFIAIDGYNFIKQSPELRRLEQIELQKAREGLIAKLIPYKRIKGHAITVVFDGGQGPRPSGPQERSAGIQIVFSRPGEKADDVLKRWAAEKKDGILLVTSDREVAFFAEKKGAKVISSSDFEEKLDMAGYLSLKGGEGESYPDRQTGSDKKGPSRRLSKSKRKSLAAAKKL